MVSPALTRGLCRRMRDSHSYVSVAKSSRPGLSPFWMMSRGSDSGGVWTWKSGARDGSHVYLVGKYWSSGSGDGAEEIHVRVGARDRISLGE